MGSAQRACALAFFLLALPSVVLADWTRNTQLDSPGTRLKSDCLGEIVVEDEVGLIGGISSAASNSCIFINATTLELTQTIHINASNFTLRGRGMNATTVRCAMNGSKNAAFIINGNETRIESLTVSSCDGKSAVVVNANQGERNASLKVSFDRVRFFRNGGLDNGSVLGGGIRIDTCLLQNCTRPRLNVSKCMFEENSGHRGGAIYGRNCELRISDSKFVGNEALLTGGAIHLNEAGPVLDMQSCTFIANSARVGNVSSPPDTRSTLRGGGALFVGTPLRLTVLNSKFANNTAHSAGGAICVENDDSGTLMASSVTVSINSSIFNNNSIDRSGLLNYDRQNTTEHLQNSGGALFFKSHSILSVTISVRNSTFHRNSAPNGGAVYFQATSEVNHYLQSCLFANNDADVAGGAVVVSSTNLMVNGSTFSENKARGGGGLFAWLDAQLVIGPDVETEKTTTFERNRALYGAGTQVMMRSAVILEAVEYRHNLVLRYGGAIRAQDTTHRFMIRGVQFENNTALFGGAISVETLGNFEIDAFDGIPTRIVGNTAIVGGGLERRPGTYLFESMYIRNTEFRDNKAASLSDPVLRAAQQSIFEDPHFSRAVQEITDRFSGEYSFEDSFRQLTSFDEGFGGGFIIETLDLIALIIAEIVFVNVTMSGNEARVGGGGYLSGYTAFWNQEPRLSCFPASFGVDSCQKLLFQNVTITNNKAQYAGGLFVSKPGTVMLTCDRSIAGENSTLLEVMQRRPQGQDSDSIDTSYCTEIHSNQISDRIGEGGDVGSPAASLHLVNSSNNILKTVAGGETLTMPCENSVDLQCPRNVTIEIKDAFNQTISRGIEDANLDLALSSQSVSGDLRYTAINGTVRITNTAAWGINVTSAKLRIQATSNSSMVVVATFSTRPCVIGEQTHGSLCIPCLPNQYGFDPLRNNCASCESHAICRGRAALVPTDSYWHSTPFSTQFHPCLYPGACTYDDRTDLLTEFYDDTTQLQDLLEQLELYIREEGALADFNSYKQCSDGYEGVLCGSCSEGYGHSLTGECDECPDNRRDSIILGVAFFIWTFLIIGANASITLLSARTRIHLVGHELNTASVNQKKPVLTRSVTHVNEQTMPEILELPRVASQQPSNASDAQTRQLFHDSLVATVQITEVLKILLNYLQVTSTALRIQVEWGSTMNGLLSTEAAFGGISCDALNMPFECHFEGSATQHPSIAALWMRMLTPSIVLCALIIVFSIFWVLVERRVGKRQESPPRGSSADSRSWKTGVIVITIVAIYFSYIDVVRELLRTVNCIDVDDDSDPSALYGDYAIEKEGRAWVEDTNLKCFKGAHKGTGIAGIFGLILAFLVIISIIVWMPLNRKNRKKPQFIARYWFLYQGYKREWYTFGWEAAILARKALMAAVVVFAVHLGQNLQAALCIGILLLALMIQAIFTPFMVDAEASIVPEYFGEFFKVIRLPKLIPKWMEFNKSMNLNSLESGSLFVSTTVFLLVVVLNDPRSSRLGEAMMITVSFTLNVLYMMFMFYRLYAGMHLVMDLKLEQMNPTFMGMHSNGPGPISLFRKVHQVASLYYKGQEDHDRLPQVETQLSSHVSIPSSSGTLKATEIGHIQSERNF